LFSFLAVVVVGCGDGLVSPQVAFDRANKAFLHGELKQSQDEAARGYQQFQSSSPQWASRFLVLEAKATLARGLFPGVLELLRSRPLSSGQPDLEVSALTLAGVANVHLRHLPEAERLLNQADKRCSAAITESCGDLLQARGVLADEQNQLDSAEVMYERSLAFARSHHDRYLESTSLLNLGNESLNQERFDEAIDRSEEGYRVAKAADARIPELVMLGNMGWAYYKLGDSEKALELSVESEKAADQLKDVYDQENALTNIGYIYMDARKLDLAAGSFQKALKLSVGIKAQQDIYNVLRVLARLALQMGEVDKASEYAQQALGIARESGTHPDELYPVLVQGQIAARRGDSAAAEATFKAVKQDKACPTFLKWEAEHLLALLYESENRPDPADREYRTALAAFEAARDAVHHTGSQLSFLANASGIYDDYVHFLVARGKTDEALRWADYSRARTLAEDLGLLANGPAAGPPPLNPREIARRANSAILFYCLGEKQSYVWAITARKANLFVLPPESTIEAAVEGYRRALGGPTDVLDAASGEGQSLYRMLIGPAQSLLPIGSRVFIIPDGRLNNLNFETLIASDANLSRHPSSEPKAHYWIEDVTIANASSLRVLGGSNRSAGKNERRHERNLLLIGNSIAPNSEYPELPKAEAQMERVARHFPNAQQRIFARERANPSAYLGSNPEQYSYIHFVAHGTASRLSPLDSAIVLSKGNADSAENGEDDSFKLYARDIIRHPLRADLVTISACYSAGDRSYSGEGLVGLSWAFLRAGAHNVISALWEVTDASTGLLMDKFYDGLDAGSNPETALRVAKLSLLRDSKFRNPFYWAPFQLYGRLVEASRVAIGQASSSKNGITAKSGRSSSAMRTASPTSPL
jgi:CHAT domain-containing protein/Tfp pilus assembly protein PilF